MKFRAPHARLHRAKDVARGRFAAKAPDAYAPPCPHYPNCIGCPFSGLPYAEQLVKKRQSVVAALRAYAASAPLEVPEVIPSPRRFGYRARVKLVVRNTRGEPATGLYVPGSHRVMDISLCPVHPQPVNRVLAYLKQKFQELEIAPYDERNDSGQVRYLDFRYGFARRELSVTLITRHDRFPQGGLLARSVKRRFPFVTGVIQNINPERGNVIWGRTFKTLVGQDSIEERVGFLKLRYPAGVFSQANPFMARRLYESAVEMGALTGKETVADLYCGVGPISFYLARSARLVCGIDDSELSIATAKQNARRNGITHCRFLCGEVAAQLRAAQQTFGAFDLIALNPPRKGVQPPAMDALVAAGAAKLLYVSCNPISLARDLDRLNGAGYGVVRLQLFDMFPQTDQVETVVLLEKAQKNTGLPSRPGL